jgi:hypothetical protein
VSEICINKLVNDFDSGAQYLVLWVSPENEYGYWYDLNSNQRIPAKFSIKDVSSTEDNRYEITEYLNTDLTRSENSLTPNERIHRDHAWDKICGAVEYEPEIYESKTRGAVLRIIAEEKHTKPSNLYKLLDRYWRSGKTKNAFIPKFARCGARGKKRKIYQNDGLRHKENVSGKTLTAKDYINFETALKRYYLNRNKLTFKSIYDKLLHDYYSVEISENSEQRKLFPMGERPSFRQFEYWYGKNRDMITEQKKRIGDNAFELNSRAILGKSDFGLMGPGAQFQIDATVGDVYLVSQFDRSNLIGRPVMYFVIDVFSRMVTGMSIGLEGPSWAGAAGALANMAADKVSYCREYGVEIMEDEWVCRHVPAVLRCDRGEMISKNADNLVNMLGIRVENAPPYRADLKGIIEQHFRTINTNSIALLPGSVKPDMSKRGGHDYRLDATLDIRQFTQIIIKCILYYNNRHYMDYFEKSEAMVRDGVEAVPAKLWNWGIRNCGALRSFPEETVRFAVMPEDKATVTGKGIRFKGLFYSCDRAIRESWFEKARIKQSWQVKISYDPRDMANIYVWNTSDKIYDICSLLDWNGKNSGKCLDEIIYEQRKERLAAKELKVTETEAKVNLNAEIETIVAKAKAQNQGLPSKSKHDRVSHIKENRRNEREAMRNLTDEESSESVKPPDYPEEMSPVLKMIKQKLEERLNNE